MQPRIAIHSAVRPLEGVAVGAQAATAKYLSYTGITISITTVDPTGNGCDVK
jgi:hypothetical protein